MIYFDNGATTAVKPTCVADAVAEVLRSGEYGNPSRGAHGYALNSMQQVEATREGLKDLLNADEAYEVVFAQNATLALNIALKGLLTPHDHVISTVWEHNSVLRPLYQLGVETEYLSAEKQTGNLLLKLQDALRSSTKMIVCSHSSNVTGNLLDLDAIKKFAKEHELLLVVDGAQTVGTIPVDLSKHDIDVLCFTGHKSLYGPQGTGGLCLKKDLTITPLITGGSGIQTFSKTMPEILPTLLEAGTVNTPGIAGLGAGVSYILDKGIEAQQQKIQELTYRFYEGIREIPEVTIYGDFTGTRSGVVSLNLGTIDSATVSELLWEEFQIATRSGFHCAPKMHEALGTAKQGTVRFSFSTMNTFEEIDQGIAAIQELSNRM